MDEIRWYAARLDLPLIATAEGAVIILRLAIIHDSRLFVLRKEQADIAAAKQSARDFENTLEEGIQFGLDKALQDIKAAKEERETQMAAMECEERELRRRLSVASLPLELYHPEV
ncbi:hypothetical protein BU26DRAFT_558015 [Trematosphaeria pertusa]|uniref:Uncharacterized protein n=1 Tax=Trematosphaeria pertusa TaxID=390896 RepID=A0A6A6J1B2_9PLEO|nr:uncharacterized protein BU26DRAFT_558015 [Trematosphaeria pertusa]KAF2256564.1 hypothetical protein BU26DRAFT_558015 [Trematosphaeria pertusa]